MRQTHQVLCSEILAEEERVVEAHRSQIDQTMKLVKEVYRCSEHSLIIAIVRGITLG